MTKSEIRARIEEIERGSIFGPDENSIIVQRNKQIIWLIEQLEAALAEKEAAINVLNKIALLGSGEKAYTKEFTNEVMGLVRSVLAKCTCEEINARHCPIHQENKDDRDSCI